MSDLHSHDSEAGALSGRDFAGSAPGESGGETNAPISGHIRGPRKLFRYRVLKRVLDIALILIISPILIMVVAVIAAAIRLSSEGPIFFSHRRIQRHGAFFTMWKFRTMCVNSADVLELYLAGDPAARVEWKRTHKLKEDPRVTRVGLFLRKTSLDELPQLWNVLMGTMSLVGPRPIVAAEVEKYGEYFADYCMVKPGITGLWQISGRSSCTYGQRVQLDRKYVRAWSLRGDAVILVKTLTAVLNQDGAY